MKNSILIFLFVICVLPFGISNAQWEPDVRLTDNSAGSFTSDNNAWCIAANGNILHVVWYDNRDGNYEIYYKRSTDGGTSWGTDTRLTNNSGVSNYPSVAVSGSIVHVVWSDSRDTGIYYKRSTDGGTSWGADQRLTNQTALFANSFRTSVAVSGTVVNVVWHDLRDGNIEVYYKRSPDGGASWGADTPLTNHTGQSVNPSIAVSGSVVHVAWEEQRDGNPEIYYRRSIDGGISWEPDTRLTNNPAQSRFASISVSDSVVHIVWRDQRDGNMEIYYKRSTDGGANWGSDTRLTDNSATSQFPSIAASGSAVHVVWWDARSVSEEIYYKKSTDGGTTWGTDTRLTNNSAESQYASVTVSGSAVHVVWNDDRDGNWEIYYKRDQTGNTVGITSISSVIPDGFSLSQNYPNPFNPSTKIEFAVPNSSFVKLAVYDLLGREVSSLVNEQLQPGTYEYDFDASRLNSGVYFYKLESNSFSEVKKMLLIK